MLAGVRPSFDPDSGLIPAIAQDRLTGEIRMVAHMNREALERTLETGRATFFSRSRKKLWEKGESSGHALLVRGVVADCDADVLLLEVDPEGPSCHTGRPNCFFHRMGPVGELVEEEVEARPFLAALERTLQDREKQRAERSYTKSLLDGGAPRVGAKIREEAEELSRAIAEESDPRVLSEAADLLYHLMVGLRLRGLDFRLVLEALADRSKMSGHAEKQSRKPAS